MMKIRIFSVGKVKQSFVLEGEKEYLKRFGGSAQVDIVEIANSKGDDSEKIKASDAQNLLKRIKPNDFLIALDERGKQFSSMDFSEYLRHKMNEGVSPFVFAIGGAYGWDNSVRKRANLVLSLSDFTLPYQLSRLVLIEQLYRANSLIQGTAYHKA